MFALLAFALLFTCRAALAQQAGETVQGAYIVEFDHGQVRNEY